jgi:hypothetical protein
VFSWGRARPPSQKGTITRAPLREGPAKKKSLTLVALGGRILWLTRGLRSLGGRAEDADACGCESGQIIQLKHGGRIKLLALNRRSGMG